MAAGGYPGTIEKKRSEAFRLTPGPVPETHLLLTQLNPLTPFTKRALVLIHLLTNLHNRFNNTGFVDACRNRLRGSFIATCCTVLFVLIAVIRKVTPY